VAPALLQSQLIEAKGKLRSALGELRLKAIAGSHQSLAEPEVTSQIVEFATQNADAVQGLAAMTKTAANMMAHVEREFGNAHRGGTLQ
jgi:hypothetical protein